MSRFRKSALAGALLVPLLAGGFVAQERATRDGARLFDQVLTLVSDRFVDTVGTGALYEKAARGLVTQLADPYSELFSPKELARFSTTSNGRYGGVGMQIESQEGNIVVVRVFPNTPAEQAGVVEGDRIVGVDTASTRGWSTQQVSDALLGVPGTRVTVRFMRPGVAQPIEHRITRAQIRIPAVPYSLMLDNNIGYVPLQTFNETADTEMESAVTALRQRGARSIVLDLRNNPGGILEQGLATADFFLKTGQEIASVRGRRDLNQVYRTQNREHLESVPLVVLVNGYSASAAEIVSGALQDHDRALVVGTTTYGKGLVQTVFPLDGGWALKLTTAKWYTPSGRSIQKERKPGAEGEEAAPDSLEADSVKRSRPAFRSDAGRLVYGGGGITPDVIVPEDTATTAEQTLATALAPKAGVVRATLYDYALQLKAGAPPTFSTSPAQRAQFYRRLTTAGVQVDSAVFAAAAPAVDQWITTQVTRLAYGDSAAFRRSIPEDPQLRKALDLLRRGQSQQDLFVLARAATGTR